MRSIVGQQLSTKAARAIYGRLVARFGGRTPTPAEVLADDPEELRAAAGLSRAKVSFLRSLAEHVLDGSLELEKLDALSDEEVTAELVAVRGHRALERGHVPHVPSGRPDILPVGDLGIRRAFMELYGLDGVARRGDDGGASPSRGGRTGRWRAGFCGDRWTGWPTRWATERAVTRAAICPGRPQRAPRQPTRSATVAERPQTAETSSSSATRKEEPQPQAAITLGLSTLKPAPWRPSTKSITEPRT